VICRRVTAVISIIALYFSTSLLGLQTIHQSLPLTALRSMIKIEKVFPKRRSFFTTSRKLKMTLLKMSGKLKLDNNFGQETSLERPRGRQSFR
jgi:hypothetical protein